MRNEYEERGVPDYGCFVDTGGMCADLASYIGLCCADLILLGPGALA